MLLNNAKGRIRLGLRLGINQVICYCSICKREEKRLQRTKMTFATLLHLCYGQHANILNKEMVGHMKERENQLVMCTCIECLPVDVNPSLLLSPETPLFSPSLQ